jgi:hypothetical protein
LSRAVISVIAGAGEKIKPSARPRLGKTERAEKFLAGLDERERASGGIRIATAALRLAQADPDAALAVLGPVLDNSVRGAGRPG